MQKMWMVGIGLVMGVCGGGVATDLSRHDMADSLLKVGGEQVPVALTPMTVFPWMPMSAEYVRERLEPFLNECELAAFDKTVALLRMPVRSMMYKGIIDSFNVLYKTVNQSKLKGEAKKKRRVALTALVTLRNDVKDAMRVLEKRQRLFLKGKDMFATVDYRKARVAREKSFTTAGKAVTAAAILTSIAMGAALGVKLMSLLSGNKA
ncbi:MAG: hypothetical protein WCJ17_02800 [bacterium]